MKFMRKYINVAKDMKPILTRAAADFIADEYSKLRNQDNLQQENIARVRCLSMCTWDVTGFFIGWYFTHINHFHLFEK